MNSAYMGSKRECENTFEERDLGSHMEPAGFAAELPACFVVHLEQWV